MPEISIQIGGRDFTVVCKPGEELFLEAAAKMLDDEAQTLLKAVGRIPENRMLLLAGLMIADKTASLKEELSSFKTQLDNTPKADPELQARYEQVQAELVTLRAEVSQKSRDTDTFKQQFEAAQKEVDTTQNRLQNVEKDLTVTRELKERLVEQLEQERLNLHFALDAIERMVSALEAQADPRTYGSDTQETSDDPAPEQSTDTLKPNENLENSET